MRLDAVGVHEPLDFLAQHLQEQCVQIVGIEHPFALVVDHATLLVDDVVELQHVLAGFVVVGLDLGLGGLEGAGHHAALDGHVLLHAQVLHDALDLVGAEPAHQVVFERQVELGAARVALAAGAAAELVVDAAGFVALGAQHVEAAKIHDPVVPGLPARPVASRRACRPG